ncbi:hypothetical protein C8256_06440 [Kluyvera genomosp. 2]|uniref:Uncharacterized protein n=1 Tax=Kluyvera genomosp. 2 TaxID=2774054 RepID=A0A2T2Y5Y1_9ENTR|nr:hypothetical protein C8256_06440 [Kluyvera genomosp. 2]
MLIFASISILILPTLTIQLGGLLIQINLAFTYHLMGMAMILKWFCKLRIIHNFLWCLFFVRNEQISGGGQSWRKVPLFRLKRGGKD